MAAQKIRRDPKYRAKYTSRRSHYEDGHYSNDNRWNLEDIQEYKEVEQKIIAKYKEMIFYA